MAIHAVADQDATAAGEARAGVAVTPPSAS